MNLEKLGLCYGMKDKQGVQRGTEEFIYKEKYCTVLGLEYQQQRINLYSFPSANHL